MNLSKSTERLVRTVAVAVACAAVMAVAATVVAGVRATNRSDVPAPAYAVGQRIDLPSSFYSGQHVTVVFFARSGCSACERSASTMAAVVRAIRDGADARATFVGDLATTDADEALAQAVGLDHDLARVDVSGLRLKYAPTTLVLDHEGTIVFSREGVLRDEDVTAIARLIPPRSDRTD